MSTTEKKEIQALTMAYYTILFHSSYFDSVQKRSAFLPETLNVPGDFQKSN